MSYIWIITQKQEKQTPKWKRKIRHRVVPKRKVYSNGNSKEVGQAQKDNRKRNNPWTIYLQNSDLTYRKEYCADVAQRRYVENGKNKGHG